MPYSRLTLGLLGSIAVSLGGCVGATQASLPQAIAPTTASIQALAAPVVPAPSPIIPSTPTVKVYRANGDCATLAAELVSVPEETLVQAVGAAIDQFATADFPIAGYRVNHNRETQTVTVDLRLPPDAPRPFASLSPCEQFALFGSIRQTVTEFEPESVQGVNFTTQGQYIAL